MAKKIVIEEDKTPVEEGAQTPSQLENLTSRRDYLLSIHSLMKAEGFNSIGDLENSIAKLNQDISSL